MAQKTVMVHVRLTENEKAAIKIAANNAGENTSRMIRKWIREAINGEPDLLTDEASLLKIAVRQLIGIANNFNQIVAAINAGKAHRTIETTYLQELMKYVNSVKEEFKNYVIRTKNRWINSDAK